MAQAKPSGECRPRGRPQLRSDEETRQIVFDAGRHAFAVDGYAATSTEELARRAGISTKTLYRLFPGKAALFEAMCADRLERLLSAVDLQGSDEVDIETGLRAALLACADLALDPEVVALQRMVLQESAAFPSSPPTSTATAFPAPSGRSRAGCVSRSSASASPSMMRRKLPAC